MVEKVERSQEIFHVQKMYLHVFIWNFERMAGATEEHMRKAFSLLTRCLGRPEGKGVYLQLPRSSKH